MKRDPKIVFGEWVELGRDEGMATGHQSSVNHMLSLALKGRREFSFIARAHNKADVSICFFSFL